MIQFDMIPGSVQYIAGLADQLSIQQLADKSNEVKASCNPALQTSDANLRKESRRLVSFVMLMQDKMPYECGLVTNLESILADLP